MVPFRRRMSVNPRPCATEESIVFSRRTLRSDTARVSMTDGRTEERASLAKLVNIKI